MRIELKINLKTAVRVLKVIAIALWAAFVVRGIAEGGVYYLWGAWATATGGVVWLTYKSITSSHGGIQ